MTLFVKEKTSINVAAYAKQYGIPRKQASEEIQNFLFENGFSWYNGEQAPKYTSAEYLQIYSDFSITFGNLRIGAENVLTFSRNPITLIKANTPTRLIDICGKYYSEADVLKAIAGLEEYNA